MTFWSAVAVALFACASTEPRVTRCFYNPLYQVWSNEPTPDVIAEDRIGCP